MTTIAAYPPVPVIMSDWNPWLTMVARAVNVLLSGKMNCTTTITFAASAATTTLTDSRIGGNSYIALTPTTANAASLEGMGWYVSSQAKGSAVITHANSTFSDRTYTVLILG